MADFLGRLQGALSRVLPDDVVLVVDLPTEPLATLVDGAGFERAVYNLVLNARDAMPGGGTITVSCQRGIMTGHPRGLADGGYVVVRVADTGHGMDAQTLERIFDPFFTTKGERGGTGLGLATVYAFAKDAGGHVEVDSAPEHGTTFTLLLPEHVGGAPANVPAAADPRPGRAEGPRGVCWSSKTATMCAPTSYARWPRTASTWTKPPTATPRWRCSRGGSYAAMCIDGVMPGLRTADVIERAAELAPGMGVLVCSGYVREDLLRRGIHAGRYAFLAKPFTADQLIASVDGVLRAVAALRIDR